jgi:hypothetical protein
MKPIDRILGMIGACALAVAFVLVFVTPVALIVALLFAN